MLGVTLIVLRLRGVYGCRRRPLYPIYDAADPSLGCYDPLRGYCTVLLLCGCTRLPCMRGRFALFMVCDASGGTAMTAPRLALFVLKPRGDRVGKNLRLDALIVRRVPLSPGRTDGRLANEWRY